MLSVLPREKAVSINFRAAASGSSSILAMDTASYSFTTCKKYTKLEGKKKSN